MHDLENVTALDSLLAAVRACSRELQAAGHDLQGDPEITGAMRAIMEHVHDNGPATVPDIARARAVSRQNIQVLVDALAERWLVKTMRNPKHRRSVLIGLTLRGERTFRRMKERERDLLADVARSHSVEAFEAAEQVLTRLTADLRVRRGAGRSSDR